VTLNNAHASFHLSIQFTSRPRKIVGFMESSKPPSSSPSRSSTPNAAANTRFAAPKATAEDLFREQTVGLVNLSDYRKRRVEAIEKTGGYGGTDSGASTPRDG
jgi:hypothetical protein